MDFIPKQGKQFDFIPSEGLKSRGILLGNGAPKFRFLLERRVVLAIGGVILVLLVWAGLFGYTLYLQSSINSVGAQIKNLNVNNKSDLAKKLANTEKSQNIINNLYKKHIYSSKFFEIIEKNTNPQIQWFSTNLRTIEGAADLRGRAPSFAAKDEQASRFKKAGFGINDTGGTMDIDGVNFSMGLKFPDKTSLLNLSNKEILKCSIFK